MCAAIQLLGRLSGASYSGWQRCPGLRQRRVRAQREIVSGDLGRTALGASCIIAVAVKMRKLR
jgi:hypothetical protein